MSTTLVRPDPPAAPPPREKPPGANGRALVRGLPLSPAILLLLLFLAGPILYCVYASFTDSALTGSSGSRFVGLDNFTKAFTSSEFGHALVYTLVFTVLSAIIGQNILGMVLALLMRSATTWVRAVVSAIVIGSWVLPEVVAGYLWTALLGTTGSLNRVLTFLSLPTQDWLFTVPILAVSLANVWRGTAFSMLVYSAALSEVPKEIEESATIDGAGTLRRLWSVTIPMVRRTIATNLMLITLQTLSVFGLIWTMTRGGPSGKSVTLPIYAYQQAFQLSQLGYGTALALILLGIGAVFSLVYLRMLRLEES